MLLKNKKASLELSISAIVVVVLAMTLLGLGLGFVRNMFKDIGGISQEVTADVKQKILDDLITNDKKLSFPKTEIVIDKGSSEVLNVGIRNKGDSTLQYTMVFTGLDPATSRPLDLSSWFQYDKNKLYTLGPADSDVRNIRLSVPSGTKAGSYFLTFEIKDNSANIYATKDLFIVVRG